MHEPSAFERQIAWVSRQQVGPLQPVDPTEVARRAMDREEPWRPRAFLDVIRLAASLVIVALVGGLLLASFLGARADQAPAAVASATPSATPATSTDAASGRTLVVARDGSGDFSTILEAVDAADDGDTIVIRPGSYRGGVIVDKDVAIVGEGPPDRVVIEMDLHPSGEGPWIGWNTDNPYGFWLRGARVSMADLTVSAIHLPAPGCGHDENEEACAVAFVVEQAEPAGSGREASLTLERIATQFGDRPGSALISLAGADVTVLDSVIDEAVIFSHELGENGPESIGLLMIEGSVLTGPIDADFAVVRDNDIVPRADARAPGDGPSRSSSSGLVTIGGLIAISREGLIEGNEISAVASPRTHAIWAAPAAEVIVRDNVIHGGGGIVYEGSSSGSVEGNTITATDVGIRIEAADVELIRNRVQGGGTGVEVLAGRPFLSDNVVTENEVGLHVRGSMAHPDLMCNDFHANGQDVLLEPGASANDLARVEGMDPC